jgi:organic hydroperoxide reductase OsmC/OhrA
MQKNHHYKTSLVWTGNTGTGTKKYTSYERSYSVNAGNKELNLAGSADQSFRGDPSKINPEEMLLASLSSCHMLWYLHLCSVNKIIVTAYQDKATGIMKENENGSGQFKVVTLNPMVTITSSDKIDLAKKLHKKANEMCFIAASVNFKVDHRPVITVAN